MIINIIKSICIFFLFTVSAFSQVEEINSDSTQTDTLFKMQKSPWGAVLRSAALPGWGQYYNESYYKIPIVAGLVGWMGYNWVINNNKYNDYKNLTVINTDPRFQQTYKTYRDFYRDQRDLFAIYIGIVYLLNLVDAYVDAHLFDFTVDENFLKQPMYGIKVKF